MKNMEFGLSFDSQNLKKEENPPIKSGDIFEASRELLEIKKNHGSDGLAQLEVFKEKLKYQKEGLAVIESNVVNYLRDNQEFLVSDIESLVAADLDKYGFGNEFRDNVVNFSKALFKRSQNIKKVLADCLDENGKLDNPKVFEKLFFRQPLGEIKIEVDNISIYFRLKDSEDFAYVASGAYKKKRVVNKMDRMVVQSTGGLTLNDYPSNKLRGLVLVENQDYYDKEEAHQETKLHEQQHSFNFLFKKFEFSDYELGLKKFSNLKNNSTDKLNEHGINDTSMIFIVNNPGVEASIKDEITAYFKGRTDPQLISKILLLPDTIYEYGSYYNLLDIHDSDGSLSYKYMKLVEQGVIAFAKLIDEGYPYDAVHAILFSEPLAFWLKIAQRIDGEKIVPEKFKELEKKYISSKVLENMKKTKGYEFDEINNGEL